MTSRLPLLLVLGLAAACTATTDDPTADGGIIDTPSDGGVTLEPFPDAGVGDPNVLVGGFQLRLVAPVPATEGFEGSEGYTSLVGKVYDGPTPSQLVWEDAKSAGGCVLRKPRVPFCNTPCGGSAVCVEDDTCKAYPTAKAVGAITVTGVKTKTGATTFVMGPIANGYQPSGDVELPFPAFAEGDAILLAAQGSPFTGAFTLAARGIAPLELAAGTLTLAREQPLALTWPRASVAETSTIHVKLDISHHGGTKGMIECDTEDTGMFELPAALVTDLLDLGVAGFPTILVTRVAKGSATISAGRVDLSVTSIVEKSVEIAGLVSCTDDAECGEGQTCQTDLTCR